MGRKSLIAAALLMVATLKSTAQSGSSSFEFVENKGQWDSRVQFRGELSAGGFYLGKTGFRVLQHNVDDLRRFFNQRHGVVDEKPGFDGKTGESRKRPGKPIPAEPRIRSHAYDVQFVDANPQAVLIPEKPVSSNTNYFIGNDPSKWARNVTSYQAIVAKNVYPNVDIRYYSDRGFLKYDIIVHPGGEVNRIAMRYEGADKLSIRNNELIVKTSVGDIRELYPYSYEFDPQKGRKDVECHYVLADKNTVVFSVSNYSKTNTLIIDPTTVFVSFTGSRVDEYGFTATPGPDGSLFSGSIVFGNGFPVTTGAFDGSYNGGGGQKPNDVGIFKFTPSGNRAWATYLGGSENEYPHSLICDPQGNLIVLGRTYSSDFPVRGAGVIGTGGGADIFVTKLNASGSDLIGSLRIGGAENDCVNIEDRQRGVVTCNTANCSTLRFYGDDSRSEVVLDKAGNIYVVAQTQSPKFPIIGSTFQTTKGNLQDGVVMKIKPDCSDVIWSSFIGGNADDGAFVLAVHPVTGDIYVGGSTLSTDLPKATGYQTNNKGGADGFVAQISNDGTTLIKTTYLGTSAFDAVYGIQFDRNMYPYVMGITEGGTEWPYVNATYLNSGASQFIAKLKKDLSGFEYSTVFGNGASAPNISPVAFLVDRCENVYISGWGGWLEPNPDPYHTAGMVNMPLKNAVKNTTDGRDFYFIVLKKDVADLLYATYFGQDGGEGEHVDGGTSRYDERGVIYQAICANCFGSRNWAITSPFPTTRNVWSMTNGSGENGCNLAAVKIEFNFSGVIAAPKAYSRGVPDSMGCVPFTVELRDTIRNGKRYEWDYDGDGVTDAVTTDFQITHTFNTVGTFRVRLIAVDSSTCNIRDTAYINVRVRDDKANLAFNFQKVGPCESLKFLFTNQSTPAAGKPFQNNSFTWDFGDGSQQVITGTNDTEHTYPASGIYPVKLILTDTNYCNAPDTLTKNLRIAANVRAQFQTSPNGCAPYNAVFNNTSLGGHDFLWDFGDGSTSTQENPVHLYPTTGTYTIKLTAYDTTTCNKVHDTTFTITVNPKPTAAFTYTPVTPEVNKPTIFNNQSTGGVRYKWIFGDGEERTKTSMDTTMHQYNATGTYDVLLVTFNQFDCTDTARNTVRALINPLLDVPNAFTPGRFGRNSIVKVEGFGIGKMIFRIYNRSGVKVFESNDRHIGWDGTYQGRLQPMDVYAYTLDVEFTDGTKARKTGDITLIR